MKQFLAEFKEFISRGNVMSMAVGLIIGSAFTAIITSLVDDVITPLIGMIIGGLDFSGIMITVGSSNLMVGNFIGAVSTFQLTALSRFLHLKGINSLQRKKEEEPAPEPEIPADVQLLTEIRDMLKQQQEQK
ncbi:MAG: large conductance mechanosensitive channel protein MscL [Lachnospiraceae bacterium]|nr:large conductance mechanosensitive channel protein MscL [Lachnospiraceae bacterium]